MSILSNFAENLKELMLEHNLNAPALAKKLNIHRTNVTRYMRGERLPTFPVLVGILLLFNCSADILLGLTDYPVNAEFVPMPDNFGQHLYKVMEEHSVTQYSLTKGEKRIVSGDLMYKWLHNKTYPSVENLVKLADFMDCSVDYLLGRIK